MVTRRLRASGMPTHSSIAAWVCSFPEMSSCSPSMVSNAARVIARYVKERRVLSLEEAVRKMTSWPATRMRLASRGTIKEGNWADVTIFDLAALDDRATYDQPMLHPTGIEYVLVNGVVTIEAGKHTGARAGKVLYGPGKQ